MKIISPFFRLRAFRLATHARSSPYCRCGCAFVMMGQFWSMPWQGLHRRKRKGRDELTSVSRFRAGPGRVPGCARAAFGLAGLKVWV